ncbi:hypothetical protein NOK12_14070 [Nocardioides sp. OK12]|uniref:hypothetical protein n=1 Tax=Nocardioides sp. OK12 TaxID=2758661 RepID=UPI0021C2F3F5|nr:hypothetical protein [Nocardioides sp. OK12]GHJ58889.1 hypothetical protein NOK12_14070 [Nocardioides sp. OK12]
MAGVEVLDGGRPPRGPRAVRRLRLLAALAALLVVAGAVLAVLDARWRDDERDRLAGCEERALAAARRTDTVLAAMVAYLRPAFAAVPEGSGRDSFYAIVAAEAEEVRPVLRRALEVCRGVEVRSWHRDLGEQQRAYVAYLAAREQLVAEVAADGRVLYTADQARSDELAALREEAFGARR